jgi:hypothetical protein
MLGGPFPTMVVRIPTSLVVYLPQALQDRFLSLIDVIDLRMLQAPGWTSEETAYFAP